MQIFIASDHGGFQLKEFLKEKLKGRYEIKDFGCDSEESCDYPDFAEKVAMAVVESKGKALGILCCGTGIGMAIAANKIAGIRAAVVWDEFSAKVAKEHNDANIICLGGRALEKENALKIVNVFLKSEFQGAKAGGERHKKRIEKINALDEKQKKPAVVVSALILNEKSELFLMKSPKWNNKFVIPGGHVELGETMIDALRREVEEETGLEIYDEKLFNVVDAINPPDYKKKKHFIFHDYLAKVKPGKVMLDKREGTEFVWMHPELALKELDLEYYTRKAVESWVKVMGLAKVF